MDENTAELKKTCPTSQALEKATEFLEQEELEKAEETVASVPKEERNAEWYFTNGKILKCKGRFLDAQTQFEEAVKLDPNNQTYIQAADELKNSANGYTDTWHTRSNTPKEGKNRKISCETCVDWSPACTDCCECFCLLVGDGCCEFCDGI